MTLHVFGGPGPNGVQLRIVRQFTPSDRLVLAMTRHDPLQQQCSSNGTAKQQ